MVLKDKITLFISRAQSKIAYDALNLAENLNEAFSSLESAQVATELLDVVESLQDELLDWSDKDTEAVIDYYTVKAKLNSVAILNLSNKETVIISNEGTVSDNSWVDPYNALNTKVNDNYAELTGEIDRLDLRINNLDFSGLIPQSVLDEIEANTSTRHTHDNKTVLDSITQADLDAISLNTAHRNDGSVHVTSTQKTDWTNKVSQSELTAGLNTKADIDHAHEIEDVTGLQEAFDGLSPEKGEPGADGISPVLQAGTIEDGEYSIEVDNTDPALPVLNLTVPKGEDGQDFHIDVFANAADRLDSQYDSEAEGFSLLAMDTGVLYFRRPLDDNESTLPATSTAGWIGVDFMGYDGWSPILGISIISDSFNALVLKGWTGGTGEAPVIGTPGAVTYLGATGFTQNQSEAINIKGSTGAQGPVGKTLFPDVGGLLADRYVYDDAVKDFMYYDASTGLIYIKRSDASADWSDGFQWKGDQGDPGPVGDTDNVFKSVKLDTDSPPEITQEGEILWNEELHVPEYNTGLGPTVTLGGIEFLVFYNNSASTIPKTKMMHLVSASTYNGFLYPVFEYADPRNWSKVQGTLGMTIADVSPGSLGLLARYAQELDADTSGVGAGAQLYIKPDGSGDFTDVPPVFPNIAISIGGSYNSDVNGKILFSITSDINEIFNSYWDGTILETFNFTTECTDGVNVIGTLKNVDPTRDLTLKFSSGLYTLDTTSSDLTAALIPGTDANSQTNYVYIPKSTKVLTVSTSGWPTTEHCKVALIEVQSATTTQSDGGVLRNQNWNDHLKAENGTGHGLHTTERLRQLNADHDSGTEATFDGTGGDGYVAVTAGKVWQLHKQDFPSFDTSTGDVIKVVNHSATPFVEVSNLNTIVNYSTGSSWNNQWGKVVLWGIANKTGEPSFLMLNIPSNGYSSESDAIADASNYANYTIPKKYKGVGFLIGSFVYKLSGGTITYNGGSAYTDLRGFVPNNIAGGGGGGVTTYLGLSDTDSSYLDKSGYVPVVSGTENGLELTKLVLTESAQVVIPNNSTNAEVITLLEDIPSNLGGYELRLIMYDNTTYSITSYDAWGLERFNNGRISIEGGSTTKSILSQTSSSGIFVFSSTVQVCFNDLVLQKTGSTSNSIIFCNGSGRNLYLNRCLLSMEPATDIISESHFVIPTFRHIEFRECEFTGDSEGYIGTSYILDTGNGDNEVFGAIDVHFYDCTSVGTKVDKLMEEGAEPLAVNIYIDGATDFVNSISTTDIKVYVNNVIPGGTTGQVLLKVSAEDGDVAWSDVSVTGLNSGETVYMSAGSTSADVVTALSSFPDNLNGYYIQVVLNPGTHYMDAIDWGGLSRFKNGHVHVSGSSATVQVANACCIVTSETIKYHINGITLSWESDNVYRVMVSNYRTEQLQFTKCTFDLSNITSNWTSGSLISVECPFIAFTECEFIGNSTYVSIPILYSSQDLYTRIGFAGCTHTGDPMTSILVPSTANGGGIIDIIGGSTFVSSLTPGGLYRVNVIA